MVYIITANIWDIRYFRSRDTQQRLEGFARLVEAEDPDIVFIQESFNVDNRRNLVERLEKKRATAPAQRQMAEGSMQSEEKGYNHPPDIYLERFYPLKFFDSIGGLLTLSQYPIISYRFKRFQQNGKSIDERFCGKGYTLTHLNTPCGNILAVNTHLCSRPKNKGVREKQLGQILSDITGLQETTVLGGDLNFDSESEMELAENAGFLDSVNGEGGFDTYTSDNPYVTPSEFTEIGHNARLDRILVRSGVGVDITFGKPVLFGTDKPVSDHYVYGANMLMGSEGDYI